MEEEKEGNSMEGEREVAEKVEESQHVAEIEIKVDDLPVIDMDHEMEMDQKKECTDEIVTAEMSRVESMVGIIQIEGQGQRAVENEEDGYGIGKVKEVEEMVIEGDKNEEDDEKELERKRLM